MSKRCHWQQQPDGTYYCPACETTRQAKVIRVCRTEAEQQAAIRRNLAARQNAPAVIKYRLKTRLLAPFRYGWAIVRWAAKGFPSRSRWEFLRVYEICQACDHWDAENEACTHCGCGGAPDGPVWRNKLKMGTERCPIGKW